MDKVCWACVEIEREEGGLQRKSTAPRALPGRLYLAHGSLLLRPFQVDVDLASRPPKKQAIQWDEYADMYEENEALVEKRAKEAAAKLAKSQAKEAKAKDKEDLMEAKLMAELEIQVVPPHG